MVYTSLVLVLIVSLLLLLNHWRQNKGIIYLVWIILGLGVRQTVLLVLNTTRDPFELAFFIAHMDPLIVMIGPFLIYYIRSVVKGEFVWDKTLLVLLIPSLLTFINLIPYFSTPFENKVAYFSLASASRPSLVYLFLRMHHQLLLIQFYNLGCLIYAVRYLIRMKRANGFYIKKKVSVLFNRLLVIIPVIVIPYVLVFILLALNSKKLGKVDFANPEVINNQFLFFLTLLLPFSFFLIPSWLYNEKDPLSFFENFIRTWKSVVNEKSKFSAEDFGEKSSDLDRIIFYIESEKPYIKTAFSLHDISQALNIPHNRVANCFSKQLKVAFPTYRNKLRIAIATDLLRARTHLTTSIEGIAEMSGFNSKSIFYKIFKEEHGTTPTDWIKENLEI